MHNRTMNTLVRAVACILLVITAGCISTGGEKPLPPPVEQPPIFSPQVVMQSSDYAAFKAENEDALKSCNEPDKCAVALLNISFLYSYSKSPYFNPARGLLYLEDLIKGSPESPSAYQALVWIDLMKKGAHKNVKKRSAKEEAKAKEAAAGEAARQVEGPQESVAVEADRQQFEDEIRNKDETIRELNRQLERSRQIDIEIERKQRRLPY